MFCSNCGNELRQNLKYCNRCGAINTSELEKTANVSESGKTVRMLSVAVAWIGIAGIITIAILIGKLLEQGDIKPPAFMLVVVFCALIFGIIFLLMRQISALSSKSFFPVAKDTVTQMRDSLPHTGNTAQLEAPREPIGSVTDRTTRIFEENFAERTKN